MNYVIIGTGAAGIMAAKEIRKLKKDAQITMISADEQVHSRCMLHKYLSHERTAEELSFVEEDFFEKNQIAEVYGHIEVIDTANQMVDTKGGESICYDKLLISTGADSFIPPVGDLRKAKNVFGLRHLKDAQEIDKMAEDAEKILIIGSGLVGLDAAYGSIERGKKVTVVEMAEQILPVQLDAHAAKTYQELFEQAGVQFYLGCKAEGAVCEADGMIRAVTLDTGKQLLCDLIIVAAGVRPAVGFLEKSEIEVERGIKVNSKMETNVPNVYAAGDVTGLSGIWPNAMKQGQTAARNMCGVGTEYTDTFAAKNTINFFGLVTLCLGRIRQEEGDEIFVEEDRNVYRRLIMKDGVPEGILLQGDIAHSGIWQYMIKSKIDISSMKNKIFKITFADFYGIGDRGKYVWKIDEKMDKKTDKSRQNA